MPHRRGSFRENWSELLERFAHKGTPAANRDQLRNPGTTKKRRQSSDVHQQLFRLSQGAESQKNGSNQKVN